MIVISWCNYDKLIYKHRHRNSFFALRPERNCEQRYFTVKDVMRNLFRILKVFSKRDSSRYCIDNSRCHEFVQCVTDNYIDGAADNLSFSVPLRACRSHLCNESRTVVRSRTIDWCAEARSRL